MGSPRGPRTTGPFGTCSGLLGEIAARPPEKAVLRRAPARQASPPLRVAPPFRRVMLSADWRPSTTEKQRPAPLPRSSECCSPRQTERQFPGGYALLGGVQNAEQSLRRAPHGCQGRQSIGEWPEGFVSMTTVALHSAAVCRECVDKRPPCLHLIGSNGQLGFEASDIGLRARATPPSCGTEGCQCRIPSWNCARSHHQKLQPPFTMRNDAMHDRTPSASASGTTCASMRDETAWGGAGRV